MTTKSRVLLTFIDSLNDDAALSTEHLKVLGVEVMVLTGDSVEVALKVCQSLNLVIEADEDVSSHHLS